ncbi:MAG: hypothetical protein QM664_00680 [Flavihumibacter sp.]
MSLLNNNKNSKDKKKNNPVNKPGGTGSLKGKANTKAVSRQTKLTGGSQRGS